jgi:hypothetical protein
MEQFECVTHRVDESVAPKRRPAPHMKSRLIEPLLVEDVPGDDVAHLTLRPDDHRCAAEEVERASRQSPK